MASSYTLKLGNALNELRKQNQLCDIIINVGGRAFHAHKAVLAARSSYFMAMFTSGFRESTQSEISIEGNADIFEILITFTYTGSMEIRSNTVYDILEMACYMQFTDISKSCSDFIIDRYHYSIYNRNTPDTGKISIGHVFKIATLAKCHDNHDYLKRLAKKSEKFLCNHFQELKNEDVFLQSANVDFLNSFLEHQHLSSKEEEKEVLQMVVTWLKHDWASRHTHALQLLQKVRLGFVPGETLHNLLDADIMDIPECKKLLDEVLGLQASDHSPITLTNDFPHIFATRSTIIKAPVILTAADIDHLGVEDLPYFNFNYYDMVTRQWEILSEFILPHSASLIVVDESLYAVGGIHEIFECTCYDTDIVYYGHGHCTKNVCTGAVLMYDAEFNKWKSLPYMNIARHSLLLVHMSGFIYAIGGSDAHGDKCAYADTVERFDLEKKEWEDVRSLPEGFIWTSAVAFQGTLLVCGVCEDEMFMTCHHVIVVYNSHTNSWETKISEQHDRLLFMRCYKSKSKYPVLLVHEDVCYRVLYRTTEYDESTITKTFVNKLKMKYLRNSTMVSIGEAIKQDQIPANGMGAFRIQDEVFVNMNKSVYKTDLSISADQSTDVDINSWQEFWMSAVNYSRESETSPDYSNCISLTIDKKTLK